MLMVDLIIILFHLKLDKFYRIGVMNQLKVICYDSSFVHMKMSYYSFKRKEVLQKAKYKHDNGGSKEKAGEYYLKNRGF